jgi:nucleoside-diphosphate-sugar epimerase
MVGYNMRILITGAGGYLGTVLVAALEKENAAVIGVDLNLFGVRPKYGEYIVDDLSTMAISPLLRGVDAVVHLAGVSNDPACELDPLLTKRMNVDASVRLITAAERVGVKKFIFASSASVYGATTTILDESSQTIPVSDYAMSKLLVEERLKESWCLNPVVLRFGTLYGCSKRMRFDIAVNVMVKDAVTKNVITVNGGSQWRPFLHVADAAKSVIAGLRYPKELTCNVAYTNIRVDHLADLVSKMTGAKVDKHGDALDKRDYRMSTDIMKRTLIFKPRQDLMKGIIDVEMWTESAMMKGLDLQDKGYYTLQVWKEFIKNGCTI